LLLIILYLFLSVACQKKISLTVESLAFYNKYQLFFTKQEKKLFKSLPDKKSREEFIREFWEARDPYPFSEENEFKNEIDVRIDYADRFFKERGKSGHQTDRGRVYLLLGPPDNINTRSAIESSSNTAMLIWNYDRWRVAAIFIDKHGFGVFRLRSYDLRLIRLLNMIKHANIEYFGTNKKKLNIRLIEPTIKYNRAKKTLFLQFQKEDLTFEQQGKSYMTKIKIEGTLYKGSTFEKIFKIVEFKGDASKFLEKKNKLIVEVPLPDLKGKIVANIIITDMIAKKKIRKIVTFKMR